MAVGDTDGDCLPSAERMDTLGTTVVVADGLGVAAVGLGRPPGMAEQALLSSASRRAKAPATK